MGFLDNSGDIILDAVLTDTGRMRLARGDGSFKIVKFALGDDEIDYTNYNKNHASGSAFADLEILQSPIFEAFTNNTSLMKSKLISIARNNLLYLPELKIDVTNNGNKYSTVSGLTGEYFVVTTTKNTEENATYSKTTNGTLYGVTPTDSDNHIVVSQGLDTTDISYKQTIDPDLKETQYIIEMDDRLGSLITLSGESVQYSFKDDDNVASYFVSLGVSNNIVFEHPVRETTPETTEIRGPAGTQVKFKVKASIELQTSDYLYGLLGFNDSYPYYIDSTIKITGATTGVSVDVPVRYVKGLA